MVAIVINLQKIRYGLIGLGDVRWHITWVQHFYQHLAEGIWYPRWLAGTNFGYGSPTFVFYPPFPYYVGSFFKFIGLSSQQTMNILFSLPIFLSGLTFYLYGYQKWGKFASFGGALCYMLSPFLIGSINSGGLSTVWAIPWIPLGLYLTEKTIEKWKYGLFLSFFVFIVALTHTPSLLIYTIAWSIFIGYQLLNKRWQNIVVVIIFASLGLGMASLYLLPALWEKQFVNIDYQLGSKGGFLMLQLSDLIKGKSDFNDIALKNLGAVLVFCGISCWCWRKNKIQIKNIIGWSIFLLVVFFFISNFSEFIWLQSKTLLRIQRSTRILPLFYFGQAALAAIAIKGILELKWKWRFFPVVIIASIYLTNFHYGVKITRKYPGLNMPTKGIVTIKEWMEIALFDPYSDKLIDVPEYRPLLKDAEFVLDIREKYKHDAPIPYIEGGKPFFPVPKIGQPKISVVNGDALIDVKQWSSYERKFDIEANTSSTIKLRTYFYPAWHLYFNDKLYPIEMAEDGTILLTVNPGSYQFKLIYQITNSFLLGIIISIISIFFLVIFTFYCQKQQYLMNTISKAPESEVK
ncbi:MAG: 6-pyruvoyl-tetrahydropterin synthase-related protein [Okeania sp.]|nr:6-pyruvoyl-tetrahydropterin synthase-related protein [Okeania sp.]